MIIVIFDDFLGLRFICGSYLAILSAFALLVRVVSSSFSQNDGTIRILTHFLTKIIIIYK